MAGIDLEVPLTHLEARPESLGRAWGAEFDECSRSPEPLWGAPGRSFGGRRAIAMQRAPHQGSPRAR
jgi:hypothetical protein